MGKTIKVTDPVGAIARWTEYSPLLERALEHNNGSHTISSLLSGIISGKYKMVVCEEDKAINAVSILEFVNYDTRKVCIISFLASDDVQIFKEDFLAFVFTYAKEYGAETIQCFGRKGWKRFLSEYDFNEIYTVLERKL